MSLQKLIEHYRRYVNSTDAVGSEYMELKPDEVRKLYEAAEVLSTFAINMKLSHQASDLNWVMADEALSKVEKICKE